MLKLISRIFGTKSEKDIKKIMPLVEKTKAEGERLLTLSNDELRSITRSIRESIAKSLQEIDDQIAALRDQIASQPELDVTQKEALFGSIDKLGEE
jgi:preprotein translocase subunit SecA